LSEILENGAGIFPPLTLAQTPVLTAEKPSAAIAAQAKKPFSFSAC
jgi:hypothetical protein